MITLVQCENSFFSSSVRPAVYVLRICARDVFSLQTGTVIWTGRLATICYIIHPCPYKHHMHVRNRTIQFHWWSALHFAYGTHGLDVMELMICNEKVIHKYACNGILLRAAGTSL